MNRNPRTISRAKNAAGRRAYTIIEVLVVTIIMVVLAALVLVALASSLRASRKAADQEFVRTISIGVEQFRDQFGFLPPLVNDAAAFYDDPAYGARRPILVGQDGAGQWTGTDAAQAYGNENTGVPTPRFSAYSLPYYLMGSLGARVDGVAGAGFTAPERNGTWTRAGKRYDPLLDISNVSERYTATTDGERDMFLDRYKRPILYYRWEVAYQAAGDPSPGKLKYSFAPPMFGDWRNDVRLRSSGYAIVSLGSDGLANEMIGEDRVNTDNVMEIGR